MVPELSSPASSTTTEFVSHAIKQVSSNDSQMLHLPMSTRATVTPHDSPAYAASDFSIMASGISVHSSQYVLADHVPHISTFPAHVSYGQKQQQQQRQTQQNQNIESEIERILMLGKVEQEQDQQQQQQQQQGSIVTVGNLSSEMFTPMSLSSGAGACYIASSPFNHAGTSQIQSHTGTPLATWGSQQHSPESGYAHNHQFNPDRAPNVAWSQNSSLSVAQASSVSPPMWNPPHFDQSSSPPAAPVTIPVQHVYPRSCTGANVVTYPRLPQPAQHFNTSSSSRYPCFTAGYIQQRVPAISASSPFGSALGTDAAFQGMIATAGGAHLSPAGTFHGSSDSDNTSDTGFGSSGGRDGCVNWKNKPRNSITRRQKIAFYQWLLANARFPFPTENDRLGRLAIDGISEKKFKYWFANIRCRQFTKHRDGSGEMYFAPNAKFYESCMRLKIAIPYAIPDEIRAAIKRVSRSHGL